MRAGGVHAPAAEIPPIRQILSTSNQNFQGERDQRDTIRRRVQDIFHAPNRCKPSALLYESSSSGTSLLSLCLNACGPALPAFCLCPLCIHLKPPRVSQLQLVLKIKQEKALIQRATFWLQLRGIVIRFTMRLGSQKDGWGMRMWFAKRETCTRSWV